MTDEIWEDFKVEGAYMDEFASCGPKNYGYSVALPDGTRKFKIKAKGICLTDEIKGQLNFDVIKTFAEEYKKGIIVSKFINQQQFRCDKKHNVFTSVFPKIYRAVSEKRKIVDNSSLIHTLPFGYVE
jgi:hypothetical protein